ncbi:MAG: hypothetical protein H0U95_02485 [Bacteroidetes bacterium]|nr:hypothetical protein [Bacteroidota bacterium]
MKKYCLMCGALLSDKRHGARFCSLHCKNKYSYKERVGQLKGIIKETKQEPEKENPLEKSLRRVIDNEPEQKHEQVSNKPLFNFKNQNPTIDSIFFNELINETVFNVDNKLEQSSDNQNDNNQEQGIGTKETKDNPVKTILPEKYINKEVKTENPFYNLILSTLKSQQEGKQKLEQELRKLEADLKFQAGRNGNDLIGLGAGVGGLIGLVKSNDTEINKDAKDYQKKIIKKQQKSVWWDVFKFAIVGAAIGKGTQVLTQDSREKDKLVQIAAIKNKIITAKQNYQNCMDGINNTRTVLAKTTQYTILVQKVINPAYEKALNRAVENIKPENNLNGTSKKGSKPKKPATFKSDKIIPATDLAKIDYKAFSFDGLWKEFFGCPSINFHALIHGNSGEGKSTFSMWLARYLAENFGLVLYVSGEEGLNKTFQDKLKYCKAEVEDFYVLDVRTGDELIKEVGVNEFNFIILDSLHDMEIDSKKLKAIFERYKNTAFICIDQNNKKGDLLGANEKKHLVDIVVNVKDYTAETTKNRFKAKGVSFKTADFTGNKNGNGGKGNHQQDLDSID